MTITIRFLILIWILVMKTYVQSYNASKFDGRYLTRRRVQDDLWRISPFNRLYLNCTSDTSALNSTECLRHQVERYRHDRNIRAAAQSAKYEVLKDQSHNNNNNGGFYLDKRNLIAYELQKLLDSLSFRKPFYIHPKNYNFSKKQPKRPKVNHKKYPPKRVTRPNRRKRITTVKPYYRKSRSTVDYLRTKETSRMPVNAEPKLPTEANVAFTSTPDLEQIQTTKNYEDIKSVAKTKTTSSTIYTTTELGRTELPEKNVNDAEVIALPIPTTLVAASYVKRIPLIQKQFSQAVEIFERKYYNATFGKLSSISPPDRCENGISFVESGVFLFLMLTALSMEMDVTTRAEIDSSLDLAASDLDKIQTIKRVLDLLPPSGDELKLRWSTRLVVNGSWKPSTPAVDTLRLRIDRFTGSETPEQLMKMLNQMVEADSGGAMRNTFEEDELSEGVRAVLLNTLYVRARWRAAPTLLNGTRVFRDAPGAPARAARMIRINDIMRYADLVEWNAEAVEISYATPGLSMLLVVPRGTSLRALSKQASATSLGNILDRLRTVRVAVTLPIYTLRMTLLLPNKLQALGISRLVDVSNATNPDELRLSHAVQRIMFWAEAGRNAFKDDGLEWDDPPELTMVVDRPYLFYVRWRNFTIMNGNFVL